MKLKNDLFVHALENDTYRCFLDCCRTNKTFLPKWLQITVRKMYVFSGQLAGQGFGKLRKEHFDKCCLFPLQIE